MPAQPREVGRPREGFGVFVTGSEEAIKFLKEFPEELDDWAEETVLMTAKKMMMPTHKLSIKQRENKYIPVDTGRLRAVFGGIEGKPNTRYIKDWARARAKSDKPFEADPIWEKHGRFTIVMGTTLFYAAIVQSRTDFMGVWLRSVEYNLGEYVQRKFNKFVDGLGIIYGFKAR